VRRDPARHEPPGAVRPARAGVRDANASGCHDRVPRAVAQPGLQAKGGGRIQEVEPVIVELDAKCRSEVRRAGGQALRHQPRDPSALGRGVCRSGPTPRHRGGEPCRPHQVHALERFDGAQENGAAAPGGAYDDIEARVHPVDTVDIRSSGCAEHGGRARRRPKPGVRGTVLRAGVRLHLDDPAAAAALASLAHEKHPDQAAGCLDDGTREQTGQVGRGCQVYISARSGGTIQPNSVKKSGMSDERKSSTTWDAL
jgi:hypothetical protein